MSDGDIQCCCKAHLFPHPPGNDGMKRAGKGGNLAGGAGGLVAFYATCLAGAMLS